jgi:prolyl-tRNA synthetase
MRFSRTLVPTLKEAPADATHVSHVLLMRGGYVRQVGAGLYSFLPLGLRVLQRVEAIVRDEMNAAGALEVLLPALLPASFLKETGRWELFGETLLRLRDRKDGEYYLGPTHEEIITDLARSEIRSYRDLPKNLYQIQTKFRDEARPRAGLLRGREFSMKDAYSFDVDETAALASYETMRKAYVRIFDRLRLTYRMVAADSGAMGGAKSAEFQVLVQSGEDELVACGGCEYAANLEVATFGALEGGSPCPECGGALQRYRGIEAGHIFALGTHYSAKMGASFLDRDGTTRPIFMGCYGIGVSRLVATAVEQHHDQHGIVWPTAIAPYPVHVVQLGSEPDVVAAVARLEGELLSAGLEPLIDDRDERPGVKFKDADLIGLPLRVTVGTKSLATGSVELKPRAEPDPKRSELVPADQAASLVAQRLTL